MARPLRIHIPNAFYHVISRGNAKQSIFVGEADYERFLELLDATRHDSACAVARTASCRAIAIEPHRTIPDFSRQERYAVRPSLECILGGCHDGASRCVLISDAYWRYGYTLREIGAFLGCHVSTVWKQIRRPESARTLDQVTAESE